ncbi:hypothetical protein [Pseudokordiimonas caeni]|uniref:hypothetical protein n=1 Tax=Pseudokordiimonas caeni TaxID=2997908 RepID=UPI0028116755|nr:hypothetical protein [Pseudokordiimonas caeni]
MSRLYYPPEKPSQDFPTFKTAAPGGEPPGAGGTEAGEAIKKVALLVPAELITAFTGLVGFCMNIEAPGVRMAVFAVCFIICWVLTPFYLNKMAEAGKPKRNHLIVSTVAFPVWAYLTVGYQVVPDYYDPGIAGISAILFSAISGVIPMNR